MPLFPGAVSNPDLAIEVSHSWFASVWTRWFESVGLKGITTHQTRATLATSLLNNGAPAELVRQLLGHFSPRSIGPLRQLQQRQHDPAICSRCGRPDQEWTNPARSCCALPTSIAVDKTAAATRIDLTVMPVEHGLCRYGPVVGGANCPFEKNCTAGPHGVCEHFVLTGADLAYWERKRDTAYHFAEGAPTAEARDYILSQWTTGNPFSPHCEGH